MYRPYYGFGDELPPPPSPSQINMQALDTQIRQRAERLRFLLEFGEPFFIPVSLGLGTTPAAGNKFTSSTTPLDFDVAIIGCWSNLRLSTVEIKDSAKGRTLTADTTPISSVANFNSSSVAQTRDYFGGPYKRPYLLLSKSIITLVTTADGTESNGNFVFYCLQPPSYQA